MESAFGSRLAVPPCLKPRIRVKLALVYVTEYRKSLTFTLPLGAVLSQVIVGILLDSIGAGHSGPTKELKAKEEPHSREISHGEMLLSCQSRLRLSWWRG